jgi:signal transduction histidine kinase
VARVRQTIRSAQHERKPILIDTLPVFLRYLAQALSEKHPRVTATEGNTVPQAHGGERARVTTYALQDLIREYQLLRQVILEVLGEEAPVEPEAERLITTCLDEAIRDACTAYLQFYKSVRENFTLALTHDLRNPLTAAKSSAHLILRRSESAEITKWAGRVVENVDRADAMLRDLLDASRLREGEHLSLTFAECELTSIARQAVAHLESMHGERFILVAPAPIHGFWSEEALRRAIENLCTNAVKYGARDQPITVSVHEAKGRALVDVHNRGSYIPPEEREALFQPFQRSERATRSGERGWGLGLTVVRGVAESHKGSINLDSLPETGTTFTLDIPIDPRAAPP